MDTERKTILVPLSEIDDNPYQARAEYDEIPIIALSANIKEFGLLQTPIARNVGGRYQLAFGHRRKRACERLYKEGSKNFELMPLIILDLTDKEMFEISLSENIKREDLNPIDRANALKRYMDEFGATSVQAAKLFGIPESTIRGMVRLLKLPEDVQKEVAVGRMSQSKARVMLQRPKAVRELADVDDGVFDLRDALSMLIYGDVRNVSDEQLFKKIKDIVNENKQLHRQLDTLSQRQNGIIKLKAHA